MPNNKKAQIGETITWVPAVIITILILIVSLYITVIISKAKEISSLDFVSDGEYYTNTINLKTEIALTIDSTNKEKIEKWISEVEDG